MVTTDHLGMLMRYTAWANRRLFDALAALPPGEAAAPRRTGAGSMLRTLNHAFVVDRIWQAHLLGEAHGFRERNTPDTPALETLRADQARMDAWYAEYATGLDESQLAERLCFRFVNGDAGEMSRGEMLLHVVNHKTYHRGYVAQMLYEAGGKPPGMDITVYLAEPGAARG